MSKKLPVHFWPFVSSQFITNLADGMAIIVFTILTSQLTKSSAVLGTVIAALGLPWLLFSVLAGNIIDSAGAYRVAKAANFMRAGIFAVLVLFAFFNFLTITVLTFFAFAIGICEVLCDNSHTVILPDIIQSHQLEKANSITSTAELVSNNFIGVNLGGLLIGFSVLATLGINGFLFFLSPVLLMISRHFSKNIQTVTGFNKKKIESTHFSLKIFLDNLSFGVRYLVNYKLLCALMVIGIIWNFMFGAQQAFLIFYVKNTLHLSDQFYTILISIAGVGGLIGGLSVNYLIDTLGRFKVLLAAVALYAVQFILKYLFANLFLFPAAAFIEGFTVILYSTIAVSYRQRVVPSKYLGRVTTTLRFMVIGAISLGTLSGGFLADFLGFSNIGLLLGILMGIIGIPSMLFLKDLNNITTEQGDA